MTLDTGRIFPPECHVLYSWLGRGNGFPAKASRDNYQPMRGKRLKLSLLPGACDWWEVEASCHVTLGSKKGARGLDLGDGGNSTEIWGRVWTVLLPGRTGGVKTLRCCICECQLCLSGVLRFSRNESLSSPMLGQCADIDPSVSSCPHDKLMNAQQSTITTMPLPSPRPSLETVN